MSDYSKQQAAIDRLAVKRRYFKSAAQFLASPATKDFAEGLIARIEASRDSHISTYDSADPTDSLTIARCQEARKVCKAILGDFDPDICSAEIKRLDNEIKQLHNTIETKKKKAEQSDGGYGSVVRN